MGSTALAMAAVLSAGVGVGSALAENPPQTGGGTILALGGNSNPEGQDMQKELSGYFSGEPGTAYAGRTFRIVEWPAQTPFTAGWTGLTYDQSQQAGISALEVAAVGPHAPQGPLLVVGYSASAGVVMTTLRKWDEIRAAGGQAPSPDDTTALVFGNPNRPNGGVFARFPGLYAVPFGMTFTGPAPVTSYKVTDVSWEYDGVSDFPRDPSNGLALLNAAFGFLVHGDYKDLDLNDTSSIVSDVTVGNTRYVTVRGEYIPLLMPLRLLGVPTSVLDAIEPVLRARIEQAYDRTTSPGTPTPARIGSGLSPQQIVGQYVDAIDQARQTMQQATAQRTPTAQHTPTAQSSSTAQSTSTAPQTTAPATSTTSPTTTVPTSTSTPTSTTSPSTTTSPTTTSPASTTSPSTTSPPSTSTGTTTQRSATPTTASAG
ncbi:PE-PPE domain-containing protein [Williamsia sp. SKLECPSW1]